MTRMEETQGLRARTDVHYNCCQAVLVPFGSTCHAGAAPEEDAGLAALLGTMGFGAANAYALMVFCLLYVPCTATIATINREVGSKKITFGIIMFQLVTAWVVSFIAYHIAGLVL